MKQFLLTAVMCLPLFVLAQSGPGGVSNDSDPIKNCRLWLDAGDLAPVGDGNYVYAWRDKSNSAYLDSAFWRDGFQIKFDAPLFRSDPAYGINGKPVISFEDGGMLVMGLSPNDPNQNPDLSADAGQPTSHRTVFVAFRTGSDITTRQYLWEQGGGWKGMGMYISNSHFYIGVYDLPGSGNASFGYCYKKAPVQPNTTYVVSLVLDAPIDGTLNTSFTNNNALRGTINGGTFGILEQGASKPSLNGNGFGVGAIGAQGDPIGIGGVNSLAADEVAINDWSSANNPCVGYTPCNNTLLKVDSGLTGQFTFKGRIAELCYYAFSLNDAERIIVENYLAAKYFANVIANDKYEYQTNYGNDVIGIGAENAANKHNNSKGDNLFSIHVDDMASAFLFGGGGGRYLLTGHNGNPLQWTNQNTPDSANIKRLRRTWRFDRSGFNGTEGDQNVYISLNPADIPALPNGYKLAVLIDDSNGPLPNFASTSKVIELPLTGGMYTGKYLIPDGTYFTLAAVKPTIQFKQNSAYTLETDDPTPTIASVDVELNYIPRQPNPINTGVTFLPLTALNPEDFTTSTNSINIPAYSKTGTISFNIINEDIIDTPAVKSFLIVLNPAATDPGFSIGKKDTLNYLIYDDDPDPKATFLTATNDTISEAAGLASVIVRINGTTTASQNRKLIIFDSKNGTASYGVDYTLLNAEGWRDTTISNTAARYKVVEVPHGTNMTESFSFPVIADNIDEFDESIIFQLVPIGDIGADSNSIILHTINLVDANPTPVVEFLNSFSEGFEAVAQPRIVVDLSSPSAKIVEVPFSIVGGTATNGAISSNSDYTAVVNSSVVFSPGDTISYLYLDSETGNVNIQVYSDTVTEPDETIIFELGNNMVNAQPGSRLTHTYTILDYKPFEYEGVAGVGKARDNIFWMKLDGATLGQNGNIPQLSPRPINIAQSTYSYQPTVETGINNQKVLSFNGSYKMLGVNGSTTGKSPFVNSAGFYDSKDIFFVITVPNTSTSSQIIFEEGGDSRGLNVYLKNNKIYFQAWNTTDNDGSDTLSPWGGNNSYAQSSTTLTPGNSYVISCHYHRGESKPLKIYVNGVLDGYYGSSTVGPNYIGRLYVHSDKTAIGGMFDKTRLDDGPQTGNLGYNFQGKIAEMVYFTDRGGEMNEARIQILHNYFSARFNIPLSPSKQIFDLAYADQTNTNQGYVTYNKDVAGIGTRGGDNKHGVAKGPSQLKVSASLTGTNNFILWGHNGESLVDTWTHSYGNADLPAGIQERSGRVWRFSKNKPDSTQVKVEMNFSESPNALALTQYRSQYLRLLISDDPDDWSGATVYSPSFNQPDENEGARVIFDTVKVYNGAYLALANKSPINLYPLPIELLEFTAKFVVDKVDLNWSTASEVNNDYFIVERAGGDLKWNEVLRMAGAGFSNTTLYYNATDPSPLKGVSYYRLKQVDYDGNYKYSDVVSVVNRAMESKLATRIYPNPVINGYFIVDIPWITNGESVQLTLASPSGKIILREQISGNGNHRINCSGLAPGIYLVSVVGLRNSDTVKLVVNR